MSSNNSNTGLVFVTGGSGFIGFHILTQLLDLGYSVRAAARGKKIELLKKALSVNYSSDRFEVVEVPDIASSDLSHYLKETAFKSSVEGSLHILREAVEAKIHRIVITGSVVTFPFPQGPFGADDWNPVTKEQAIASGQAFTVYMAQKKYADLAVVEFAEKHPETDVTLVGPHFNFGPFAPGFEYLLPEPDLNALSTNGSIYALLRPGNTEFLGAPGAIDVRDAARAHVVALQSRPSAEVGRKRFAIVSPHRSSYKDALAVIAKERSELKDRLTDATLAPEWPSYTLPVEWQKIEDVLGLKADSFIPWERTVLDAVDSLVRIEGLWKEKGFKVPA
ncbi:NAD(P)-binding protein [Armillaria gallica]|uniref:NAD(P)-binding protein n=1 Tax=Armillaria gallica TaxID=47427 RepID=A0A2H3D440_ARMGA|nr:NAD(P)-binding protein [Armillaria gallica]